MTIESLLDGIESGHIPLADFQRDFDWSGPAIRSLLATVLMGWPAGSLLAVDGSHPDLSTRRFEGGPKPAKQIDLVVLDGQQRLTALLQVVGGKGPAQFSVPLGALETDDVDQIEESLKPSYGDDASEALFTLTDGLTIPLKVARSRTAFQRWRQDVIAGAAREEQDSLDLRLSQVYRDHLHWLHDHEFAVVILDAEIEAKAVARIFERVNRTGLRLGSFDLVVARAYSHDWKLRDRWEEARFAFPLLDSFLGDDGLPALQTIALREEGDVRQSAVLDLDTHTVLGEWDGAVEALNQAIHFLKTQCGVVRRDRLPYPAFVLLLAALARDRLLSANVGALSAYVITRSFGLRFDAAANTRVVADYHELRESLRVEGTIAVPPSANARLLAGSTRQRQSAIFRAFLCLLAVRGAQDLAGRPLELEPVHSDSASGDDEAAVVVSVVPRDDRDDERLHLRTLGMVLAHPTTALEIRTHGVEIGTGVLGAIDPDPRAAHSQLLPPRSSWTDTQTFLADRLAALTLELSKRFGQEVVG